MRGWLRKALFAGSDICNIRTVLEHRKPDKKDHLLIAFAGPAHVTEKNDLIIKRGGGGGLSFGTLSRSIVGSIILAAFFYEASK